MGTDAAVGTGFIAVGIFFLLLVIAGVATLLLLRARRAKARAKLEAMSAIEREHHDALVQYESSVKAARDRHLGEVRARDARLRSAQNALASAEQIGTRTLGAYRGREGAISLTEAYITTPQGSFPLTAGASAVVDTAGNLATSDRTSLGRIAAGGLVFGPVGAIIGGGAKKTTIHDTRELYLLVEGPGFATLLTCNPNDGPHVRQFAVALKQAAFNIQQVLEDRAKAIREARAWLEAETANVAPLEEASRVLEAVIGDTSRRDAALLAVESADKGADTV